MYKIKLQPGDYARRDMGEDKYRECAQRFLDGGCHEIEDIGSFFNEPFFGWLKGEYHGLYHGAESAFTGRLLTYEQIMEKDMTDNSWHEKGELPPVGTECEWDTKENDFHEKVQIAAIVKGKFFPVAIMQFYDDFGIEADPTRFRPIKSDREKAIEEIYSILASRIGLYTEAHAEKCRFAAEALYDAGYRKTQ